MILKNELHWLTRHFKGYSVPLVVYDPNSYWPAYYWTEKETIVLRDVTPGNIAHEYRHHLQISRYGCWYVPEMEDNWDKEQEYYSTCYFEHEAMRFEGLFAGNHKDWGLEYWLGRLELKPMSRAEALLLP